MPERDPGLLLEDIEAAIAKIERYSSGIDRERFLRDEKTVDAVVRNLELIGEAARRLPQGFKASHPSIPLHQIAGLRNRIVHDYFGLDLEIVWQVVSVSLPELKAKLKQVNRD